jgi:predicted GNAT family N-acyltransferase
MAEAVEVTLTSLGTPLYAGMLDLRDRVLRRPIGLVLTAADLTHDAHADLIVAHQGGRVVGCCLLTVEAPTRMQLRAMAVEPELQGRDIGRRIVDFAEATALRRGATEITLDARETAVGFYARLGYTAEGDRYTKVGIPHFLMRKPLATVVR